MSQVRVKNSGRKRCMRRARESKSKNSNYEIHSTVRQKVTASKESVLRAPFRKDRGQQTPVCASNGM